MTPNTLYIYTHYRKGCSFLKQLSFCKRTPETPTHADSCTIRPKSFENRIHINNLKIQFLKEFKSSKSMKSSLKKTGDSLRISRSKYDFIKIFDPICHGLFYRHKMNSIYNFSPLLDTSRSIEVRNNALKSFMVW